MHVLCIGWRITFLTNFFWIYFANFHSLYARIKSSWILSTGVFYLYSIVLHIHPLIIEDLFGHSFILFTALILNPANSTHIGDWTGDHNKRVKRQTKSRKNQRKNSGKRNKNSNTSKGTKNSRNKSQSTNNCLSTGMNWRQYQSYTVINRWY